MSIFDMLHSFVYGPYCKHLTEWQKRLFKRYCVAKYHIEGLCMERCISTCMIKFNKRNTNPYFSDDLINDWWY